MIVLPIVVTYKSDRTAGGFKSWTDAKWDDVRGEVCDYMEINRGSSLGYRQLDALAAQDESNELGECYGPFRPLNTVEDWEEAVRDLRRFRHLHLEMEILPASARKVSPSLYELQIQ